MQAVIIDMRGRLAKQENETQNIRDETHHIRGDLNSFIHSMYQQGFPPPNRVATRHNLNSPNTGIRLQNQSENLPVILNGHIHSENSIQRAVQANGSEGDSLSLLNRTTLVEIRSSDKKTSTKRKKST